MSQPQDSVDAPTPQSLDHESAPLPSHIPALDGLRGLAILLVTIYRFSPGPSDDSLVGQWLFSIMHTWTCGVDLFFVLSGFLITGILFDTKEKDGYLVNFFGRRSLRIFPLYFAVLAIAFLLFPLLGITVFAPQQPHQAWLWCYGTNIFQSIQGSWCLGPFDHFWSLAVEEHFYLVWPLVIGCLSRTSAMRTCVAIIIASVVGRVGWMLAGGNEVTPSVLTLFRADALAVGAWLALAVRDRRGIANLATAAWTTLVITGLLLIPVLAMDRRLMMIPEALLAWFFGSLLLLAVMDRGESWLGWLWNNRFLQWLSKYGYGMYVYQNLLIPIMAPLVTSKLLCDLLGSALLGRLCYIGIMSTLTFAVAAVSWHCFEERILRLKEFFSSAPDVATAPKEQQHVGAENASLTVESGLSAAADQRSADATAL